MLTLSCRTEVSCSGVSLVIKVCGCVFGGRSRSVLIGTTAPPSPATPPHWNPGRRNWFLFEPTLKNLKNTISDKLKRKLIICNMPAEQNCRWEKYKKSLKSLDPHFLTLHQMLLFLRSTDVSNYTAATVQDQCHVIAILNLVSPPHKKKSVIEEQPIHIFWAFY